MNPDAEPGNEEALALQKEINQLEAQIADLKARFPAHSLNPSMLAQLDELDEELAQAREKWQKFQNLGKENTSSL